MAADSHGDPQVLAGALHAAQAGDENAFRTVYRAQQPALLRYLTVLVGADAEDVASEAWLQIARDLRTFRGDWDGFKGWSATIARNRATDHLRRLRRRPVSPMPIETAVAELAGTHDTLDQALETLGTDAAIALIALLPRDQAEAVMLRAVAGLDAESAGRILGKRAGAVRTAAHRGLRKLSDLLAAAPEGVTPADPAALKGVR